MDTVDSASDPSDPSDPPFVQHAVVPNVQQKKKRKTKAKDPFAVREAQEVPRAADGLPILPIKLSNSVIVYSLGVIVASPKYFTSRYLFPVGFKSGRLYNSFKNPGERVWFTSEIVRGPEGKGPVFKVTAEDAPDDVIESHTATGAWTEVLKKADEGRNQRKSTAVSGPEQYGYVNPTIARLLEGLPGVDKCHGYKKQRFTVIGMLGEKRVISRHVEEEEELATGQTSLAGFGFTGFNTFKDIGAHVGGVGVGVDAGAGSLAPPIHLGADPYATPPSTDDEGDGDGIGLALERISRPVQHVGSGDGDDTHHYGEMAAGLNVEHLDDRLAGTDTDTAVATATATATGAKVGSGDGSISVNVNPVMAGGAVEGGGEEEGWGYQYDDDEKWVIDDQ